MPDRDGYEPGTPGWIDLTTPDVAGSTAFYTQLFGWTAEERRHEGEHIYTELSLDGKAVCGLGPQQPEMAGMPPIWATYVIVEDAAQATKAAEAAGGTVMLPPMEVMAAGHMAIFADPTGAAISVWQPGEHTGAQVVNEYNTYSWNELMTRDVDAALSFYAEVFGWTYDAMDMGPMGTYHLIRGGEEGIGGIMAMPPMFPEQVPNHWGVYFTIEDSEAFAARVTELGGTIVSGPDDTPVGRITVVHDPQGGSFSVMQPVARQAAQG